MMMAAGVGGAAAQGRSPTTNVRFGVESVYDAISTAGGPATARDGASRFRADFSTRHSTRRARWQIQSGVTADQMWQSSLTGAPAAAVNADYAVVLDRRSRFDLTERLTSAPIDLFTILGSTDPVSSSPLAGSRLDLGSVARSQTQSLQATLTRTMGARSVVSATGSQMLSVSNDDRVASLGLSGRLARRQGRFTGWHLGYGFSNATVRNSGVPGDQQRHDVDVGFDYARPLAFSRHTTVSVTTGSTVLTDVTGNHMRMSMTAALERQMTRSWNLHADYSRPIEYVPGFSRPFLSDAVRVSASGVLPHRVSLTVSGGAAHGALGTSSDQRFSSYTGSVRVARRVAPTWEMQVEYRDARYRIDAGAPSAAVIPAAFARRGLRAGIVWSPIVGR